MSFNSCCTSCIITNSRQGTCDSRRSSMGVLDATRQALCHSRMFSAVSVLKHSKTQLAGEVGVILSHHSSQGVACLPALELWSWKPGCAFQTCGGCWQALWQACCWLFQLNEACMDQTEDGKDSRGQSVLRSPAAARPRPPAEDIWGNCLWFWQAAAGPCVRTSSHALPPCPQQSL